VIFIWYIGLRVLLWRFLYLMGFFSNEIVPRSIAVGPVSHFLPALIVDVLLISLFAIQHSILARPGFKAALSKY
jgi:methanethiol S-methyltransferase